MKFSKTRNRFIYDGWFCVRADDCIFGVGRGFTQIAQIKTDLRRMHPRTLDEVNSSDYSQSIPEKQHLQFTIISASPGI